jgi:3-methyl-2-oxobutanoate hydroxymethyltransferase
MNALEFKTFKETGKKISMVTCYDYSMARIIEKSNVDAVLVGDSLSMVVYGYPTTLQATTEMMAQHTAAVSRGLTTKFIIADMPFLSFRKGLVHSMETVEALMRSGAHGVKCEGVDGHETDIEFIVKSGIPVMGHLGLTPQSIHALGGFKVQGRNELAQEKLLDAAKTCEDLGCFSLVLECIPESLAQKVTQALAIPTIGIGAGRFVDGQVLVINDLLGMNSDFKPKFLRKYFEGESGIRQALDRFSQEVKNREFPMAEESYG